MSEPEKKDATYHEERLYQHIQRLDESLGQLQEQTDDVAQHLREHLDQIRDVAEFIRNYRTARGAVSWLGKGIIWAAAVIGGIKAILMWGTEVTQMLWEMVRSR